ncbi:MAG: hypothetical protein AAB798_02520 [Patescibacteria group bacterium]
MNGIESGDQEKAKEELELTPEKFAERIETLTSPAQYRCHDTNCTCVRLILETLDPEQTKQIVDAYQSKQQSSGEDIEKESPPGSPYFLHDHYFEVDKDKRGGGWFEPLMEVISEGEGLSSNTLAKAIVETLIAEPEKPASL